MTPEIAAMENRAMYERRGERMPLAPPEPDAGAKIVAMLQERGEMTMAELGAALGVAKSTMANRLKRLRKNGLIHGEQRRTDTSKTPAWIYSVPKDTPTSG